MGRLTALRAYTRGGAYANHSEAIAGTLEVGRLADFQVYEDDPISRPPSRWPGLRPRLVALAGARVYPA